MTISVIKPSDIDTSKHFFDAFGNCETEISAWWIVKFCQARNSWAPFFYDELNSFYTANGYKGRFWFNRLTQEDFVQEKDGFYHITHRFVCRCYEASPKGEMSNGN